MGLIAYALRRAQGSQKRLELATTVCALVEVIANQRHRCTRLRSGDLRLRKTIQPLETLVAADLGLVSLGYNSHQFNDITTLEHRKTPLHLQLLDSPYPSNLTLGRRPPALLLPRGQRPPSASSAFCGHRAAACRGRSGWCPCAWRPPRWASPPVSPPPPPLAACPSVPRRPSGATPPAPCSGRPAVRGLAGCPPARGQQPRAGRTGPAAKRRATACA